MSGAPGWLSRLIIQFLILAQAIISGSCWAQALCWALCSVMYLLKDSLSASAPPSTVLTFSLCLSNKYILKKKKKKMWMSNGTHRQMVPLGLR